MKKLIFSLLVLGTCSVWALDCPKVISVQVIGLKSTSASDFSAIERISKAGDSQSSISYIATILESLNAMASLSDTLKLSHTNKSFSSFVSVCYYKGSHSSLSLHAKNYNNTTGMARLNLGEIDYKNSGNGNPISHKGFGAELVSNLTELSATTVTPYKNKSAKLLMNLEVQIPLNDGTDSFNEAVEIGSAKNVVYKVLR